METNAKHRGIIKREQVRLDDASPRSRACAASRADGACAPGPRVRLVTLDENTHAFEFTCSCGEVSLIEIQYEAKS